MKLLTWNINGIRATKEPIKDVLRSLACDIICFQETKVTRDLLESDIALVDGYSSYYSFSQAKQGYSGVATYCREHATPIRAQEGLFHFLESAAGDKKVGFYGNLHSLFTEERMLELDKEGRTIITQHEYREDDGRIKLLTVINVYCPRADPEKPERREYKMDFYKALEERSRAIKQSGSSVIVCGDLNTSHRRIDHCDPDDPEMFYDNPCREWMDSILYNKGDYSPLKEKESIAGGVASDEFCSFVDAFRFFFPVRREAFTCWCTLKGCRQTNYGTRLDYILGDAAFVANHFLKCDILPEVEGSDHCPVEAEIACCVLSAKKCPPCCTKYMPEFGGRQQKLLQFFKVKSTEKNSKISKTSPDVSGPNHASKKSANKRKLETSKTSINKQTKLNHYIKSSLTATTTSEPEVHKPEWLSGSTVRKNGHARSDASLFWKALLKGPDPPPFCKGHNEPCVMRTVKKDGQNFGKKFYCCSRPEGHKSNVEARCSFFQWKD